MNEINPQVSMRQATVRKPWGAKVHFRVAEGNLLDEIRNELADKAETSLTSQEILKIIKILRQLQGVASAILIKIEEDENQPAQY